MSFRPINIGVIGTGWVGGIRANACANSPLVKELHIAEINPLKASIVGDETNASNVTNNWHDIINNDSINAVIIASTPESERYPIVLSALKEKKSVLVEKPIAPSLAETDEAIRIAHKNNLKLTVGYTRRFDPRYAYVNQSIKSGRIGDPVTCLLSRNITREIGTKIKGRSKLSPASMGGTHSIDFLLWCLQPRLPVRVYYQQAGKLFSRESKTPDHQWIMVTMDDGSTITAGSGWVLPLGYPQYSQSWIEIIGTDGSLTVDDTHKEIILNSTKNGIEYPLSSMPGEQVDHVFAGAMVDETIHFLNAVCNNQPLLVTAEEARLVMEVTNAADISAESGHVVSLI